MRRIMIPAFLAILMFICCGSIYGQQDFPEVKLKTTAGHSVNLADLVSQSTDTIVVMSFWATWCIPCITELDNINEVYPEMQAKTPFKFYGVSIDDSRTAKRVKPFITGKGWKFEVLMDINGELKRALNITDVPHVMIVKDKKIVYRHTGYIAGQEEDLYEEIKRHQ